MPHIHTDPYQYDLSVTLYTIRLDERQMPYALFHLHKKHRLLLPVGGHIELDETPWCAAARELEEESGYVFEQIDVLQPISRIKHLDGVTLQPYPISSNAHSISATHFHTDISYALVTTQQPKINIADGESSDIRWYSVDEIKKLPDSQIFSNTRAVYLFIMEEALKKWEQVPASSFAYKEKTPPV